MLNSIEILYDLLSDVFLRLIFFIRHKIFSGNIKSKPLIRKVIPGFLVSALTDLYACEEFNKIEEFREKIYSDRRILSDRDMGAGSFFQKSERSVGDMLKTASVNRNYGRLLSGIAHYFNPGHIVELGTAAGISTMYLASGAQRSSVTTIEANKILAAIAKNNFIEANYQNISLINSDFDKYLPEIKNDEFNKLMVYIDGNHKFEPSIRYFNFFAELHAKEILIIFDDIYWSAGMVKAWRVIISDKRVNISIDLYYKGIVYINNNENIKCCHFNLNYN